MISKNRRKTIFLMKSGCCWGHSSPPFIVSNLFTVHWVQDSTLTESKIAWSGEISCSSVNYCNCNWLASDWKLTNRFVTSRSENIKILLIINLNWRLAGSVKDCAALKLFLLTFNQRRRYQVREKLVFYKIWETEFMVGETSQIMWLNNN